MPLSRDPRIAVVGALGLYSLWMLLTYLLEGRRHTLLRPEAAALRLVYALVANLLVGVVAAVWFLCRLVRQRILTPRDAGFRDPRHAAASAVVAGGIGLAFYVVQGPPSLHPMVLLNGFAQTWVVSTAEVLICWAVVGAITDVVLRQYHLPAPPVCAAIVASGLFGMYHVAHSPPFHTLPMVLLLSGIGLLTSAFFFVCRDVYGTIVLHHCFALFGVLDALRRAEALSSFTTPMAPLWITALVSVAVLSGLQRLWLGPSGR